MIRLLLEEAPQRNTRCLLKLPIPSEKPEKDVLFEAEEDVTGKFCLDRQLRESEGPEGVGAGPASAGFFRNFISKSWSTVGSLWAPKASKGNETYQIEVKFRSLNATGEDQQTLEEKHWNASYKPLTLREENGLIVLVLMYGPYNEATRIRVRSVLEKYLQVTLGSQEPEDVYSGIATLLSTSVSVCFQDHTLPPANWLNIFEDKHVLPGILNAVLQQDQNWLARQMLADTVWCRARMLDTTKDHLIRFASRDLIQFARFKSQQGCQLFSAMRGLTEDNFSILQRAERIAIDFLLRGEVHLPEFSPDDSASKEELAIAARRAITLLGNVGTLFGNRSPHHVDRRIVKMTASSALELAVVCLIQAIVTTSELRTCEVDLQQWPESASLTSFSEQCLQALQFLQDTPNVPDKALGARTVSQYKKTCCKALEIFDFSQCRQDPRTTVHCLAVFVDAPEVCQMVVNSVMSSCSYDIFRGLMFLNDWIQEYPYVSDMILKQPRTCSANIPSFINAFCPRPRDQGRTSGSEGDAAKVHLLCKSSIENFMSFVVNKGIHAQAHAQIDWIKCVTECKSQHAMFLALLVALQWLIQESPILIKKFCASLTTVDEFNFEDPKSRFESDSGDGEKFSSILKFVTSSDAEAFLPCLEKLALPPHLQTGFRDFLVVVIKHHHWCQLIFRSGNSQGQSAVEKLAHTLTSQGTKIPISFLYFLKSSPDCCHHLKSEHTVDQLYAKVLIGGEDLYVLRNILESTEELQSMTKASRQLSDWYESYNATASDEMKARIRGLQDRIKSSKNAHLPDCLGMSNDIGGDSSMFCALQSFKDDGCRSFLVHLKALELLQHRKEMDLVHLPSEARKLAIEELRRIFSGNHPHQRAILPHDFDSKHDKEKKAICDLLHCNWSELSSLRSDPISQYLRLMRVDPLQLRTWMLEIRDFIVSVVGADDVPDALQDSLSKYTELPFQMPIFAEPLDVTAAICADAGPRGPSLHHLWCSLQTLCDGAAEQTWPQISYLGSLRPLLDMIKDPRFANMGLDSELNRLRVMCVTDRELDGPVGLLCDLAPLCREIQKGKSSILSNLGKLLRSRILFKVQESTTAVSGLARLFEFTNATENIRMSNIEVLRNAHYVIRVQKLITCAKDPMRTSFPYSFVEMHANFNEVFRLSGRGLTKELVGIDIQDLFTELKLQNNRAPPHETGSECHKVLTSAQRRFDKLLSLAERIHQYSMVGALHLKNSQHEELKFQSEKPMVQKGRLLTGKVEDPCRDVQEMIDDYIGRHENEKERLSNLVRCMPWTSHAYPVSIADARSPWVRYLARCVLKFNSDLKPLRVPDESCPLFHAVVKKLKAIASDVVGSTHVPETQSTGGCKAVSIIQCGLKASDGNYSISDVVHAALPLLSNTGATCMFPCDASTVKSSIEDFCWRTDEMAQLISCQGKENLSKLLASHFLFGGTIVSNPENLDFELQNKMINSLLQYAKAASLLQQRCPPFILLCKDSENRFKAVASSIPEFHLVSLPESELFTDINGTNGSVGAHLNPRKNLRIWIQSSPEFAHGKHPVENVFRIRLGQDMAIGDLLQQLSKREYGMEVALCFGCQHEEIFDDVLGPALISLIFFGVVGQSQHVAEVLSDDETLHLEFVSDSAEALKHSIPWLAHVPAFHFRQCTVPCEGILSMPRGPERLPVGFQECCARASEGNAISDQDVEACLCVLFERPLSKTASRAESQYPFVHSRQSLEIMATAASRIKDSLQKGFSMPVLLKGDTGTGKTYLLYKLLELLRTSGAVPDLQSRHNIVTLSAAFRRKEVTVLGAKIQSKKLRHAKCSFVVDETTSSPAQECVSRLLCHREADDGNSSFTTISRSSILLLATCNPDVKRDEVFSLTKEMDFAALNVDPLSPVSYAKFLKLQLQDANRGPGFSGKLLEQAVVLIELSMRAVQTAKPTIGSISLRDAVRCAFVTKRLLHRFPDAANDVNIWHHLATPASGWYESCERLRSLFLACYICFGMRVLPREHFYGLFEKENFKTVRETIAQVKRCILKQFHFAESIVPTGCLQDNVLASFIAISLRLPLLCLGSDGTSKTLSLSLIVSQMQGMLSQTKLLQSMPRLHEFRMQISDQTKAEQIVDLKKTILAWSCNGSSHPVQSLPCVFLEEMSMATQGPSGPLRALHDLLDSHQESAPSNRHYSAENDTGTGSNQFCFLCTSNFLPKYELPTGRALGNRMLILAHEDVPTDGLVELAVTVGMACCFSGSHEARYSEIESHLRETVGKLCSFKRERGGHEGHLVPHLISVRSLLWFAKSLAVELKLGKPLQEAQNISVAAHCQHLQHSDASILREVVSKALEWGSVLIPSLPAVLEHCLGNKEFPIRRPLLFTYDSPKDVRKIIGQVQKAAKSDQRKSRFICPSVERSVHGYNHPTKFRQYPVQELLEIRDGVEQGNLIFVLNPEPVIEGIHALLNDVDRETTTIQIRQAYEIVRIDPKSRIILIVEKYQSFNLHRALLSRVAVINHDTMQRVSSHRSKQFQSAHHKLSSFYRDSAHAIADGNHTQEFLSREAALLQNCELPLAQYLQTKCENPNEGMVLNLACVPAPVPRHLISLKSVCCVDAALSGTLRQLYQDLFRVLKAIKDAPKDSRTLIVDLTCLSVRELNEVFAVLGMAVAKFDCHVIPSADLLSMFKQNLDSGRKTIFLFNSACARAAELPNQIPFAFEEIRDVYAPYPEWPRVVDMAVNCKLVWDKAVEITVDALLSCCNVQPGQIRVNNVRELAAIALKHCAETSNWMRTMSEGTSHTFRLQHFKTVAARCQHADFRGRSFRDLIIEEIYCWCHVSASRLVSVLPVDFLAHMDQSMITFVHKMLVPCTFSWQKSPIPDRVSRHRHGTVASWSNRSSADGTGRKGFPLLNKMKQIVLEGQAGFDSGMTTQAIVRQRIIRSFPSFKTNMQLKQVCAPLCQFLVQDILFRYGSTCPGEQIQSATKLLEIQSEGLLDKLIYLSHTQEAWLAAGTFFHFETIPMSTIPLPLAISKAFLAAIDKDKSQSKTLMTPADSRFCALVQKAILSTYPMATNPFIEEEVRMMSIICTIWKAFGTSDRLPALALYRQVLINGAGIKTLLSAGANLKQKVSFFVAFWNSCKTVQLPIHVLSSVSTFLEPDVAGHVLIAESAMTWTRNQDTLKFLWKIVEDWVTDCGTHPALMKETTIMVQACTILRERKHCNAMQCFQFLAEAQRACAGSGSSRNTLHVITLSFVASFREDLGLGQLCIKRMLDDVLMPGIPAVRKYIVRCLIAENGEELFTGRHSDPSPYINMYGEWIKDYFDPLPVGRMSGLMAVAGFSDMVDIFEIDRDFLLALGDLLQSRARGSETMDDLQLDLYNKVLAEEMSFCRLPCALWMVSLTVMANQSPFGSTNFCTESHLGTMCVPASPDHPVRILRKSHGNTSINKCPCGYYYVIGECGRPMQVWTCPDCGRPIGGRDHVWANGNQGVHDDPIVSGIDLNWFQEGYGHTERDLEPLHYRILAVLLLLPLAISSPKRHERLHQLKKHWDALKRTAELGSDLDVQHFLIGLLGSNPQELPSLALVGHRFGSEDDRKQCERSFAAALSKILGQRKPADIVAETQAILEHVETAHPVMQVREGFIKHAHEKDVTEAAEDFAPWVLSIVPQSSCHAGIAEAKIEQEALQNWQNYPLLCQCLFNSDYPGLPENLKLEYDLDAPEKLSMLSILVQGFLTARKTIHEMTVSLKDPALHIFSNKESDVELQSSFRAAWKACQAGRYRVGCQQVDALPNLETLLVEDLVVQPDGTESHAKMILTFLIDTHNHQVESLISGDDIAVIKLHEVDFSCNSMDKLCVPWREARDWIWKVVASLPSHDQDAATAEHLVREKLRNGHPLVKLSMCGWPMVVRHCLGMIRLPADTQEISLPEDSWRSFEKWRIEKGLQRDTVFENFQWIQLLAVRVKHCIASVSSDSSLDDWQLDSTSLTTPSLMRKMMGSQRKLKVCHINAVQALFFKFLDQVPESKLEHRFKASCSEICNFAEALEGADCHFLLDQVVSLVEVVLSDGPSEDHNMLDWLPFVREEVEIEDEDLSRFDGMQLRHLHDICTILREKAKA